MSEQNVFKFKQFDIVQDNCTMKINTDGVLLGAWSDLGGKVSALDIGTGTGVIALMVAQRNPNISVVAIEIDESAYGDATYNVDNSIFGNRIQVINTSLQDFANVHHSEKFELIVSNPPFFSGGTFSSNENKANVRHTIKLSHQDLLWSVKKLLHTDGSFDVILPYIEGLRFIEMAEKYDLYLHKKTEVRTREHKNIERLLLRFGSHHNAEIQVNELILHAGNEANEYTDDFVALTKEFYLFL